MYCNSCGAQLYDGAQFCNLCGTPQPGGQAQAQPQSRYQQPNGGYNNQQSYGQPAYQQQPYQNYQQPAYQGFQQPFYNQSAPNITYKEFYKQFVSKKSNSYVTWMVVICFVTAVLSAVIMTSTENMLSILDIVVYVISGILLLNVKHWVCALIPTLYGALWTIVSLTSGGTPTGIVAIIVGANCIMVLEKANKAYKAYKTSGIIPDKQI